MVSKVKPSLKAKPKATAPKSTKPKSNGRVVRNSNRYNLQTGAPIDKSGETDYWRQQNGDFIKPMKKKK